MGHVASDKHDRAARRARRLWWATGIAFAFLLLPLGGAVLLPSGVVAQDRTAEPAPGQENPRAEYWRAVRESAPGYTAASGPYTTNTLIQNGGENWRLLRNNGVTTIGGWLFGALIVIIAAFYFYRGRIQIEAGRSEMRVPRFTLFDRTIHWANVALVLLLAITGLLLLYGRELLIPLIGYQAFASVASASMQAHNLFGPIFIASVIALFLNFLRGNGFAKGDLKWLLRGGGLLKGKHASAGRYNTGEKLWFWVASLLGLILAISGVILLFPNFGQDRLWMQVANLTHGIAAIIFIAGMLAHAYIGTLGMEGAVEGMSRGTVDANWAKEHHDLWYQEMERKGRVLPAEQAANFRRDSDLERTVPAGGKAGE